MRYRHRITGPWLRLGLLVLLLPLIAACGGRDTAPAASGEQQVTKPASDTAAEQIIPVEGQAFSGQERATQAGTPALLAFDALG